MAFPEEVGVVKPALEVRLASRGDSVGLVDANGSVRAKNEVCSSQLEWDDHQVCTRAYAGRLAVEARTLCLSIATHRLSCWMSSQYVSRVISSSGLQVPGQFEAGA